MAIVDAYHQVGTAIEMVILLRKMRKLPPMDEEEEDGDRHKSKED